MRLLKLPVFSKKHGRAKFKQTHDAEMHVESFFNSLLEGFPNLKTLPRHPLTQPQ
jgi:hypothetical protein